MLTLQAHYQSPKFFLLRYQYTEICNLYTLTTSRLSWLQPHTYPRKPTLLYLQASPRPTTLIVAAQMLEGLQVVKLSQTRELRKI